MMKSPTVVGSRNEFKRETERKILEQKKDMKVMKNPDNIDIGIPIVKLVCDCTPQDERPSKKEMEESPVRVKNVEELIPHIKGSFVNKIITHTSCYIVWGLVYELRNLIFEVL